MEDLADANPALAKDIMGIMESGNALDERGDKDAARSAYHRAWDLLPEPKLEWPPLSAWITASFYNLHFDNADFAAAKQWAQKSLQARESGSDTGPLIDLGMAHFELEEYAQARTYFDEAYRCGKARAFQGRPRKYLAFCMKKND
ncbi:tetratricopeptide repeat protein [Xanthomonas tesorieronis]|uniref:tetratricopeptide repeat protein n=1 Tax=Xanthomonas tesorieronis TaxID=3160839 RepID=UPI0035133337